MNLHSLECCLGGIKVGLEREEVRGTRISVGGKDGRLDGHGIDIGAREIEFAVEVIALRRHIGNHLILGCDSLGYLASARKGSCDGRRDHCRSRCGGTHGGGRRSSF